MLRFDNVSKTFGKSGAGISDVSFTIKDGEFVFLTGPSGAGKTTLLRLLIRDFLPGKGNIYLDDVNIARVPRHKIPVMRRMISMVFQDFKVLYDRTVGENVAIVFEVQGKSEKDVRQGVDRALEMVKLDGKINKFPLQLSAGEIQRVSIARSLAASPKVILADEPTGNLDPKTGYEILRLFEEINKKGTTIIMATHNAEIVNKMKKRVIHLIEGKIVKDEKNGKYS